ncbi:MAG: NusG domain II-containing protein [Thiobacillaceae bacterium]
MLRWGDVLVLALGLLVVIVVARVGAAGGDDRVLIKQAGHDYAVTSLRINQLIDVPGPLGITQVEIRDGQVRVRADPGPRQVCVRQGWLAPGETALCLPNRVTVQRGAIAYDSLNY